ncbi:MAG: cobaltochelatase subunit CobN, partial [Methanobrevibacter thaueri]|nr:cobaltochelatase subunit CobN [Methanobrevibacter thaueri]
YQWVFKPKNPYLFNKTRLNLISLHNLTQLIFDMNNKGSWAKGLLNTYVEENWDYLMQHHQLISLNDFEKLTSDVNDTLFNQMISYWKDGLGPAMVYKDKYIVIPGVWFGNVFITFQPSRGWEEVQDYHSLTIPPHQQYVAFYKWLDKTAKMNAIISMGTHGTLEWLPGVNLGAFPGDWTFELTLLPTIYPYIVSNPGEAMVARDRSSALLITHMTPAMVSSELYGNYTVLKNYINYYNQQVSLNVTSNAESYKEMILELAPSLGFRNISKNENFQNWIDELHIYLDDMEDDFNTYGLHHLGKILSGYELSEEVITIVTSQTKIYDQLLEFLYPNLAGLKYYDDIQGNLKYLDVAQKIKSFLKQYSDRLVNGTSVNKLNKELGILEGTALYNSTKYCEEIISNIRKNNEWNAILLALNGRYVEAGLFADPSYGDSIPTGYDGYASDPTRMPSPAAYNSAVKIVDMLLANYYQEHGKWPELTSLILWGTEISRTEGIGVAEFLYLLGCKPVWADNGKVLGVEQIPLDQLTLTLNDGSVVNRPRVDVFASMVTNNKDWITWMLTAVDLAVKSGEDASNNYVVKHYAENPHLDRLFGLPGNVLEGTGMSNLIPNTADWSIDSVSEYAMDIYLNKVSYSWTLDDKGNIKITKEKDTYKYLLDKVDVITQNFDSSWRLFDSDDYYDWFGGLYNAANVLKQQSGKDKPDTAFFDIRNKNNYISRTYQEELDFEVRSMLLNPQYYGPLVKTAAGMNSYASRFQNFYAATVLGGGKLNKDLGNQLADAVLKINEGVNSNTLAAGAQSSAAWLIYMAQQKIWDGDAKKVQELVDAYMKSVIEYGVACCHHTCKNLEWNSKIIQLSSLTPAQKQKFAEILAQATQTDPLYQMDQELNTQGKQGDSGNSAESGETGNQNANVLSNSTSQNSKSDGSNAGGKTAVGDDLSQSGDAKSQADSSSSQDASSGGESTGGAKSYELSESSTSKSASSTESSMPMFVIIAVIVLIAIFLFGYVRKDDEDYDEY